MNNIDTKIEKAIEVCVQKYFKYNKGESVIKKNILNLIKEYIDDYATYDHYYPYTIHWVLESKCNLRCKHCLYLDYPEKYNPENNLSTQQAMNLIDELFEMDILTLTLTGGEIFLRDDIFEIITKIKTRNIALSFLTNATLITHEIVEKLKKIINCHIDKFQISLDGASSITHDKNRGKGSFDKTIKGIKLLVEAGFNLSLMCIPTTINIHELTEVYNLAEQLGVKDITMGRFKPFAKNQEYLVPDTNKLFEAMSDVINLDNKKEKSMLNMSTFNFYDLISHKIASKFVEKFNTENKNEKPTNPSYSCHNNHRLCIDRDGKVYLCIYAKDMEFASLGNVKEKTIKEMWHSRIDNILFQKRDMNKISCKKCNYFQNSCYGGCIIDSYLKYNSINAPDRNCPIGMD